MSHIYSIYDTKAHLSRLLKMVQKGREIVITERGKAIAKIVPCQEETTDERIKRMITHGLIRAGNPAIKLTPLGHRPGAVTRFIRDRE